MSNELYSDMIVEYYKNPVNFGRLEPFDLEASGGNPSCGDQVVWTVRVHDGKIAEILFTGRGCAISRASACVLSEMVAGKTLVEIQSLTKKELFDALGGVIETRIGCAILPLATLQAGLSEFEKKETGPVRVANVRV